MPSANFTIDDTSPLIQYAGIWRTGNDTSDPLGHLYSNGGTFTLCNTLGTHATFTFNGTQVYVYGAKRDNHGPYSITLDGTTATFDGFSETALWTTLFVSDALTEGLHTVTVTNQMRNSTNAYLDIDYITWTSTVTEPSETTTLEDTASGFSYEPEAAWSTDPGAMQLSGFSSGNGHMTISSGASVSLTFQGDFVTIFGAVGPSIAPYSVQLDGTPRGTLNATKPRYTAQVALYHADNLGTGLHTLVLISQPAAASQVLAIDYAQVAAVVSSVTSGTPSSSTSAPVGSPDSRQSVIGSAVGGAFAGVVFLGLLVFLVFCVTRRRARRARHRNGALALSPYPSQPQLEHDIVPGGQMLRTKGLPPRMTPTMYAPLPPDISGMYLALRKPHDEPLQLPPDYAQATAPERQGPG